MDTAASSELADVVRASVVALRAATQSSSKVFALAAVSIPILSKPQMAELLERLSEPWRDND